MTSGLVVELREVFLRRGVQQLASGVEEDPRIAERVLRAGPLPEFVKGELEGFAGCGDLELGFVRTCCRTCGDELRVPFACKSRGLCPLRTALLGGDFYASTGLRLRALDRTREAIELSTDAPCDLA